MPTDSIRDAAFCDVLNRELVCALGCTEPIAVAYAAALASQTLGCEPDHMDVACSGNIIKNVKSVTVPNSGGMHGIEAAAVLGAVGGDAKSALEVLESVDDEDRARVTELLADAGYCDVSLVEGVPNLYIKVTATGRGPYRGRRDYRPPHQCHVPYARRYSGMRQVGGGVCRLRRTCGGRACGR